MGSHNSHKLTSLLQDYSSEETFTNKKNLNSEDSYNTFATVIYIYIYRLSKEMLISNKTRAENSKVVILHLEVYIYWQKAYLPLFQSHILNLLYTSQAIYEFLDVTYIFLKRRYYLPFIISVNQVPSNLINVYLYNL